MTPRNQRLVIPSTAPKSFLGFDFSIAAECIVNAGSLAIFQKIEQAEDELGSCQVLHLEANKVAAFFYRSEHYATDLWVLYIDLRGCSKNSHKATELVQMIVDAVEIDTPAWINKSLDEEVSNYSSSSLPLPQELSSDAVLSSDTMSHNQVKRKNPRLAANRMRARKDLKLFSTKNSTLSKYRIVLKSVERALASNDKVKANTLYAKLQSLIDSMTDPGMFSKTKAKHKRTGTEAQKAIDSLKKT